MKSEAQLTDDQHRAIEFLQSHETACLWADCGVGKTVSTLTAISRLMAAFDVHRLLVVGPRLVAERIWHAECAEWAHLNGLRVSRIVGTPNQRLAALAVDADIYTITRDNVVWLESVFIDLKAKKQIRRWPFDHVVLDEAQSFKSQSSQRFKSMRRLRRLFSRIWLLSGSPMPNGFRDLWSQVYLLDGGARLGTSEGAYLAKFFIKEVNDGIPSFTIKPESPAQIDALISDLFFVMRDAQPPAPVNFIKVPLPKEDRARYNKMVRTSVLSFGEQEVSAVNAGVLYGKLLQIANGAVYDEKHEWHEVHTQKIDALLELLESLPRPLLIGYSFVHDIERMQAALAKAKVPGVGVIRTNESLNAWKRGEIRVGILHPGSAGHGLNDLKDAEAIVWFGMTPNLEHYQQLNGRVIGGHRRAGRRVGIHHLVIENSVDEEAVSLLNSKDGAQTAAQIRIVKRLIQEGLCSTSR